MRSVSLLRSTRLRSRFAFHYHAPKTAAMSFVETTALPPAATQVLRSSSRPAIQLASSAKPAKKEGDISSVFVSLSGAAPTKLPERFTDIKRHLIAGNESRVIDSWKRLLEQLRTENEIVAQQGPNIVPQIDYADIESPPEEFIREVKKRGVAVVRGVVPEAEARSYKTEVEDYVRKNPGTKAYPPKDPQVFELYWSPSQVKARAHTNLIEAQRFLMRLWESKDKGAVISTTHPLAYADRVRIRQPGDAGFALGPHVDGGSVERWEPNGYGIAGVYDKVWEGRWEEYDPWEASSRVPAISDLYQGAGACSMFRMFQGWLSMSHTGPYEGTLMVNPTLRLSTVYILLRPFFSLINQPSSGEYSPDFFNPENWKLNVGADITSELQGANIGLSQELNKVMHPNLDLERTMVHMPKIKPGDYVVWHCDTIHAVDKVHLGKTDSSVIYIPVCPATESNAEYLARQRESFMGGFPGPDFPGGKGESEHVGRPTLDFLSEHAGSEGMQAMGLEKLQAAVGGETASSDAAIRKVNEILGFS